MQVKIRLIAHPLHYHHHHHLLGTVLLSTQNLLAQEADLLQDMNCSFILVGIQKEKTYSVSLLCTPEAYLFYDNVVIRFQKSVLCTPQYTKISEIVFLCVCVCVLNDGDETSQNIKRVTFSLSQSNEMKSIFFIGGTFC